MVLEVNLFFSFGILKILISVLISDKFNPDQQQAISSLSTVAFVLVSVKRGLIFSSKALRVD